MVATDWEQSTDTGSTNEFGETGTFTFNHDDDR